MTTNRSQFILINTKFKTNNTPWTNTFNFDAGLIHAREDENIKISLVKMNFQNTIHQVNQTNNQLTFINSSNQSTTITIPEGTYNVYSLIKQLQGVYPDLITATFNPSKNHFVFNFNSNHRITFLGKSNLLFGFSGDVTSPSATIESNQPAKPNPIDQVIVHLIGVSPIFSNLDNLNTEECTLSNILAVIDINDIPYSTIYFNNDSNEFQISIQDKQIKQLIIYLTDIDGNLLDFCNVQDFSCILKIEYVQSNDDMVNLLQDIKEYSRYSFLAQGLQQPP